MSSQDKTGPQDGHEDPATGGPAQDHATELPEDGVEDPETPQEAAEIPDQAARDDIEDAEIVEDAVEAGEGHAEDTLAGTAGDPDGSPAPWADAQEDPGESAAAGSGDDSGTVAENDYADGTADVMSAETDPDADRTADAAAGDDTDLTDAAATAALAGAAVAATGAGGGDAGSVRPAAAAPDASPQPASQPAPQKSRGGFFPALLGGVIAAGIGFGAAVYLDGDLLGGDDEIEQALAAQDDKLSALDARLGEIAETLAAPADTETGDQIAALGDRLADQLGDVAGRIDTLAGTVETVEGGVASLEDRLGGVDTSLADINDRLGAVERRPLTESSEAAQAAFTAYETDIEELRAALDEQTKANADLTAQLEERTEAAEAEIDAAAERAEELQAQAEEQARVAAEQAEEQARIATEQAEARAAVAALREALASLDSSLERGAPFEAALEVLREKGDVPQALTDAAADGVASLPDLRAEFPDLARDALDASIRETVADDVTGRAYAFLLSQTGLRSLEPREGDDPDAVLSRAEAALAEGDLAATLAELESLPSAGKDVLSDWIARAEQRRDVTEAATTLADTLLAN